LKLAGEKRFENFTAGGSMVKRVPREAALLMLHWQNSVCDPKGVWGKNLCRQIEKNNAIRNAQSVLATARNRGMLTIFVNIGWRSGFPEPAGGPILSPAARRQG
jgi:nicotinamidase-related amidase